MVKEIWKSVSATLVQGYGVASGKANDSPFPKGTIEMQKPEFLQRGLDLTGMYLGTLNLSIAPATFSLIVPDATYHRVHWAEGFPPEDFSFATCQLLFKNEYYQGLIYYPHPQTKLGHFHGASILEVIAPPIAGINYGDNLILEYNAKRLKISP